MNKSNIEWTEITWNPTTGCTKVSSGCRNCYAERWANMQHKRGINQYRNGFELTLATERLNDPLKWKKPQIVFVNSMSDLFHDKVETDYIKKVFSMMNSTPKHTYQILTKRIERVKELSDNISWSDNIWLGVSVESNDFVQRIEILKKTSAKVKFISFEPLLGDIRYDDFRDIDWVLVGGESGGKARRVEKEWIISLRDNCKKNNVAFFFKQWGKRIFNPNTKDPTIDKTHLFYAKGGCMIDNKIYREYPNIK
ncbi:MAG: phage Gp37/Gp68 family protein [Chryseobacterium gambrini]|nr:phage Gp37/Gp68 family protein [Chryseobacterium gambrini]